MKTAAFTLLQLLAFLALVVGCDGSSDPSSTSIIYRGNGGDPGSLDPASAEDIHAFNILTDLYEGLVAESATGEIVPGVAESWTIGDDGMTYTFTLRPGARWSNGDRVTSLDFVNAFRRVANPDTASIYGFLLEPILHFTDVQNGTLPADQLGVTAVDERILEIRLVEPSPQILAVLAMPISFPAHYSTIARHAFSNPDFFVGNGAYSLIEYNIGGRARLRRSPTYWDASSVAVDEIVYLPIVDPRTELNLYRTGEVDITNTIPSEHVRSLRENLPDQVRIAPSLALYYLAFDLTEPPLDNALLRQALTMAIDREQLVSLIGRGEQAAYGVVPHGVTGHVGSEFAWAALSDDERLRQARGLYRDAGYSDDSPLAIKYTYDAGDIHEKVALAVSSMWREFLGVEVTLDKREWQYFLQTRDKRAEWQIMRFAWFGDYNHASTFTNIFRSSDPQNLSAYANPEYDRLLAAASSDTELASHSAHMTRAESLLLADHPIAPLYFFVSKHLVRPGIAGFEKNALDRHPSKYLSITDEE
ncbi:MAG: peptide ABC transporter substrate-binding protein [Gammaproteobacteria bacterium]|nr:peptide ABC transporter substrate-binding protein [Gammaproteobacteria bacterium]